MTITDDDYPRRDCQGGLVDPVEPVQAFTNRCGRAISDHRYDVPAPVFQHGNPNDSTTWAVLNG